MARGRILSRQIAIDIKFNKLTISQQWLFMRLLPFTDDYGRVNGNLEELHLQMLPAYKDFEVNKMRSNLNALQKAGAGIIGASALNSITGGLGDDTPAMTPGPIDQSGYLTESLTPAMLSDVYGTQGSSTGISGSMPSLSSAYAYDPVNSTIAELLREKERYELEFPEFARVNVKDGGIARLADGGELPEVDLREHGGETHDSEGSGDEDTIPALLADGEFVMTKQSVKGIGDGDHDKGIARLYAMMDMNENKAQMMGLGRA